MLILIALIGALIAVLAVLFFFFVRFLNMKNGKKASLVGYDYDCNDPKHYPKWRPHVNDPKNPFNQG